jgi:hypothetical protein
MKGLLIHHDLGPLDALVMAEFARQLQGGLVGFQAGGAEKDIAHARQLDQFLGQNFLVGYVVIVAAVDDLSNLILQRRHQLGVVVAQGVDRNTTERVQIRLAIDIPHPATLAV